MIGRTSEERHERRNDHQGDLLPAVDGHACGHS